jgi:hypothetical protein
MVQSPVLSLLGPTSSNDHLGSVSMHEIDDWISQIVVVGSLCVSVVSVLCH